MEPRPFPTGYYSLTFKNCLAFALLLGGYITEKEAAEEKFVTTVTDIENEFLGQHKDRNLYSYEFAQSLLKLKPEELYGLGEEIYNKLVKKLQLKQTRYASFKELLFQQRVAIAIAIDLNSASPHFFVLNTDHDGVGVAGISDAEKKFVGRIERTTDSQWKQKKENGTEDTVIFLGAFC